MVWVIPVFLLWIRSWGPADPVERLEKYLSAKEGSVEFTITSPQFEGAGKGSFRWRKPGEQAFAIEWSPSSAAFVQSPGGAIEIDRVDRTYLEFPGRATLAPPPSIVTPLPGLTYPMILFAGGLGKGLPPTTKFTPGPKETIGDIQADRVDAHFTDGQVTVEAQAYIATDGRLLRYREKSTSPGGVRELTWTFSNWNLAPTFPAATFARTVPDGYVPFSLAYPEPPVEIGDQAPFGSWTDARSGKPLAVDRLAKGKWTLVGFFDREDASRAALAAWPRLAAGFVSVAVLDGGGVIPSAGTAVRDSGAIARRWRIPGYPFFALVDPSGKIALLSFGFSPADEAALRKALVDAKGR